MQEFFLAHQTELFWSLITFIIILLMRLVVSKTTKRIGRINNFVEARRLLIAKYTSVLLSILGLGVLIFIWGVNFQDLGLIFSSIFTIMGVALFAQWSILSNITAGVILFFTSPYKIGDQIRIFDKEILDEAIDTNNIYTIEDIRAFHLHLRKASGELLTYPNNMMLQKAVALVNSSEVVE